jgi:PIN domain nuclease of toxin-antitoxin system
VAEAVLLDASAVLTLLHEEPGTERVAEFLPTAAISAVNLAEVLIVLERRGVAATEARRRDDPRRRRRRGRQSPARALAR